MAKILFSKGDDIILACYPSCLTPVLGHLNFIPGLMVKSFQAFQSADLTWVDTFLTRTGYKSLTQLQTLTDLPLPFWNMVQLRYFLSSLGKLPLPLLPMINFEKLCVSALLVCNGLSLAYKMISPSSAPQYPLDISKWESGLGVSFSD